MFLKSLTFSIVCLTLNTVSSQDDDMISSLLDDTVSQLQALKADLLLMEDKTLALKQTKVEIKLYYECRCPGCRHFDTMTLKPTVEKLASNLNLKLYPYGKAQTIDKGNGVYEFKCQHGPEECYGNKLHACAIDYLGNQTEAVFFNSCMMDFGQKNNGSDDEAADKCGKSLNVDPLKIKQCAKGAKGTTLLKYYGDKSKKVGFKFVPYILINGVLNNGEHFMKDVCAAFATPPPACAHIM